MCMRLACAEQLVRLLQQLGLSNPTSILTLTLTRYTYILTRWYDSQLLVLSATDSLALILYQYDLYVQYCT